MINSSPIPSPLPELVQEWINEENGIFAEHIATRAAQWGADQQLKLDAEQIAQAYQAGADQELEACIEWLDHYVPRYAEWSANFRAARRPKSPSLKEQALEQLGCIQTDLNKFGMGISTHTIRLALEALPE
jgi:hypothetical protein